MVCVAQACARNVPPDVPALFSAPRPNASADAGAAASGALPATKAEAPKCLSAQAVAAQACSPDALGIARPPSAYGSILRPQGMLAKAPLVRENKRPKKDPAKTSVAPRALTPEEAAFVEEAHRFVCTQLPSAERTEVQHALARTYFEAHHWDEAAALFHENAEIPGAETATYAAQLSLESLNVLGSHMNRPDCFTLLADWTNHYFDTFCGPSLRPANEETCVILGKIQVDLNHLNSERLHH